MDRLVAWIALHPVAILACTAVLAAASGLWAWRSLRLDADTNSLIGDEQPFMRDYLAFMREFGDLEYLLVVVDPKGHDAQADEAVHELVEGLRRVPGLPGVTGFVSAAEQFRVSTWAMQDEALHGLHLARGALAPIAAAPGAGGLLRESAERLERLMKDGAGMDPTLQRSSAAEAFLLARCALGGMPDAPESLASPLPDRLLPADGGHLLLVLVMPAKDYGTLAVIEEPLARMREVIAQVQRAHPSVEIGLTGKPVLQADEMATTSMDMNIASVVALVLCAVLFMAVFRGVKRPLLAVAVFLAGAAMTYGAATALIGHLNLLSMVFMLVLVGVALDYGIHMIARYLEGLRHLGNAASVRHMVRKAAPSMLMGALTCAGTFLLALVAPMRALRELGVISGAGLLLCAVCMAVVLPALLLQFDRSARREPLRRGFFEEPLDRKLDRHDGRATAGHWLLIAASVCLAVAGACLGARGTRFENNLLKLQAEGLPSVAWQRRLQAEGGNATWFGACVVDSMDRIPALANRAKAEPLIAKVRSVLDVVRLDTPERAALRQAIGEAAVATPATSRQIATPELADRAARAMGDLAGGARLASAPAADVAQIEALRAGLEALNRALREAPDATVRAAEQAATRAATAAQATGAGARASLRDALPDAVRNTFTSADGHLAVTLHPAEDIWEGDADERFVQAMRRVDPAVTGAPVTVIESMKLMTRSFLEQAALATAFVAMLLLVDFRSWRLAALSLLSLAMGLAWTFGAMALLGVPLNLANFFAIPVMIGLAVDSCIHVTHRAVDGGLQSGFGSTRRAVIVTALTTTIDFGTLLFAQHRGMQSLGAVMAIASVACLASSAWLLPAMLRAAGFGRVRVAGAP